MQLPNRDAEGLVEPHDHHEILNEWLIIRRICPQHHIVPDENRNCQRISSKAFKPSSGLKEGMSIDLKSLIELASVNVTDFVTTPIFTGSVEFLADIARGANLQVGYDPLEDNPYHGEVWGPNKPNRFSNAQTRAMHSGAQWLVPILDVEII